MNRKFIITGVCLVAVGLMVIMVLRGGKRMHQDSPRGNFSLTVDLPKTNNTASKPGGR